MFIFLLLGNIQYESACNPLKFQYVYISTTQTMDVKTATHTLKFQYVYISTQKKSLLIF